MMKTPFAATVGLLAVLLPPAIQAAPKPPAPPESILVTLQVMEVPSRAAPNTVPSHYPTTGIYDALLREGDEAAEVSVQTPNDFPSIARYSRIFAFAAQDHGKPTRAFLTAPTSLEAWPHINDDGTITVSLVMEVTRVVPFAPGTVGRVPATTSQSMTTRRTFKSGQTILLGSTVSTGQGSKPGALPETRELLQFVTVTVLPGQAAAR